MPRLYASVVNIQTHTDFKNVRGAILVRNYVGTSSHSCPNLKKRLTNMEQDNKKKDIMVVHSTVYDIDMFGNPYTYETTTTYYFSEWADFDD